MLTLPQKQRLKAMGITVWRLRGAALAQVNVAEEVQPEPEKVAVSYWSVDVFVKKWQARVSLVSRTEQALDAERALLQAIAKAVGEVDNEPQCVTQLPDHAIVALGALADHKAKVVCALDYTVSQILANTTLKRPVWQVLQRFIARSSPFEDTQGNSSLST